MLVVYLQQSSCVRHFKNPARKQQAQQVLENAKAKLNFFSKGEGSYSRVGVEEMDSTVPYGPEYNDFNCRIVSRLKVKARLQ